MAISIFPSTAAEFVSNNFVVDMNDTNNNSVTLANTKQAGTYNISLDSGDTSFDVYFLDSDGALVAYSNTETISPADLFTTVVILGVATTEQISFSYAGSVSNADGEGDEPGAGAYLESITPSDLPSIDDTATVAGGNFASDVEITFESGATVLSAKNIVVNSSTELLVTRPDGLVEDDAPYTLKAINPGVTPPTGTDAHILTDAVTAGSDPTWVTGPNLTAGEINVAYAGVTLEATDAEGTITDYSVTSGSLPTGLSLNSTTGEISGTPTASGQVFTVTVSDDGGNTTSKEFSLPVQAATGGTITTDTGAIVHTFDSTDDFIAQIDIPNVAFVLIGGGGGSGTKFGNGSGGGGGGGIVSTYAPDTGSSSVVTVTAGTHTATIGAGGNDFFVNGGSTSFGTFGTALGGGGAGEAGEAGEDGASGGGGGTTKSGGTGSNGGDGGSGSNFVGGSGGGGGAEGTNGGNAGGDPGVGTTTTIRGTSERFSDGGEPEEGGRAFTLNANEIGGDGAVIVRYV